MAALAIAIRLFEFDHDQRPQSLELLVPDYLPVVPEDPFSPERGSLKYNGTLLYSFGPDDIDNNATVDPENEGGDTVFQLDAIPSVKTEK